MFLFSEKQRSLVLFSIRDKKIAITFHEHQILNIGNQYQKDGIIEKFEYNNIPHQIDETVKERQMKYQKIVQALVRILYLIGKQGISYPGTQKTAANSDAL